MIRTVTIFLMLLTSATTKAQDSLLSMLDDSVIPATSAVTGTFKGLRIVNTHTIESPARHDLNFIIMHRFGKLNDGAYNFFGLDNASIRLGLDYGITDRLAVGIGRSSFEKMYDGYLKYRLLQQKQGSASFPFSMSILAGISNYTLKFPDKPYLNARYRTAYFLQAILAKKVSSRFSIQLSPSWLHYNLVPTKDDNNDLFATTVSGRIKLTKRTSITAEYNYLPNGQVESIDIRNSFSAGVEIETGGHVFQLVFTNAQGMVETQYIARTTGSWTRGDIYFGFNVSRNFTLGKKEKKKDW